VNPALVDPQWWPARVGELVAEQMKPAEANALSTDLPRFIERVESGRFNGIVGDIHNAATLDPGELMRRMLDVARRDVAELLSR
jgi:hypothetical protein